LAPDKKAVHNLAVLDGTGIYLKSNTVFSFGSGLLSGGAFCPATGLEHDSSAAIPAMGGVHIYEVPCRLEVFRFALTFDKVEERPK
jgi:hypothetical protein